MDKEYQNNYSNIVADAMQKRFIGSMSSTLSYLLLQMDFEHNELLIIPTRDHSSVTGYLIGQLVPR